MSANSDRWGYVVGTGVEFGLWGNWSTKIEYDYLNFGSYDVALTGTGHASGFCENGGGFCGSFSGSGPVSHTLHVKDQIQMVQVGLNYKFDWGNGGH